MSLDLSLVLNNNEVWCWNITHNLNKMALEAGLYEYVWQPEENEIYFAEQMIDYLKAGIYRLKNNPGLYKEFNPDNGWGDYDGFLLFIESYLVECERNPLATIESSR